jgi:DNA/RNA endonuclease YhcR with UshA esterase domain
MAITYKVLGQSNPSATTATTLYTVPSATNTIVATISVCNQAAGAGTYRIAVRPAGETLAAKHYIVYDVTLPGVSTDTITIGLTLEATDVVTVYASSANFSFNAYGSEIA